MLDPKTFTHEAKRDNATHSVNVRTTARLHCDSVVRDYEYGLATGGRLSEEIRHRHDRVIWNLAYGDVAGEVKRLLRSADFLVHSYGSPESVELCRGLLDLLDKLTRPPEPA